MMQINVPEKNYWPDQQQYRWFAPKAISEWLEAECLDYRLCGSSSCGDRQDVEMNYIVRAATSEQAILFKLRFPDCKIYHSNVE
jgi:hypothetical protein